MIHQLILQRTPEAFYRSVVETIALTANWCCTLILFDDTHGYSTDLKALVPTAFDAMFFFDTPDHVYANIMALLCQLYMQSINTVVRSTHEFRCERLELVARNGRDSSSRNSSMA